MTRLAHVGIGALAVLALATGCSDDNDGTGVAAATGVAVTSAEAPATAVAEAPTSEQIVSEADVPEQVTPTSSVETGNPCLDTSSDLVQNVIATMGPPPGSDYYMVGEHTTALTPNCPTLSYAVADTPGATTSSPENILFFNGANFLQFATPTPSAFTTITGVTDDSVTVQYRWLVGDEAFCCPEGNAVVTFTWNGSSLVTDVPVPREAYELR